MIHIFSTRRAVLASAVLFLSVSGCAEPEKTTALKSAFATGTPTKAGPPTAVFAAELATALANGEAAKGTSSIGPGQSLSGTLDSNDGRRNDDSFFDAWVFVLGEVADVSLSLRSTDFDAYLSLYEGGPGQLGEFKGSDDDGGAGTDALLEMSLGPGTYTAMANSYGAGEVGAYTIAFASSGGGGGRSLRAGRSSSGALTVGGDRLQDGSYYQDWTLSGAAGDVVTVTLSSSEFDAYLMVLQDGEVVASDDDGADGTDSRVTVTLPSNGVYTVRANSYGADATGGYSLMVASVGRAEPFAGFGSGGDPDGRYALLVGIDDYPGTQSDLRGPVEDARIMERVLVERFGFDAANVVTLQDSDATRANIARGVAQHLGQAGPNGVAVLFYSGHGTQVGENIGLTGALDPEPRGQGDEAIYVYGHDAQSALLLDEEIGYLIESTGAGRSLVVVDACYSGEITRAGGDAPQAKVVDLADPEIASSLRLPTSFVTSEVKDVDLSDMSFGFGDFARIAEVFSRPQRHVAWGGSSEEQVSWTSSLGNGASVFTYYLGERMMSAPGSTTLAQLNRLVHDDVVRYISADGNMTMQNPQMRGDNQSMSLDAFFRQR